MAGSMTIRNAAGQAQIFAARCIRADRLRVR